MKIPFTSVFRAKSSAVNLLISLNMTSHPGWLMTLETVDVWPAADARWRAETWRTMHQVWCIISILLSLSLSLSLYQIYTSNRCATNLHLFFRSYPDGLFHCRLSTRTSQLHRGLPKHEIANSTISLKRRWRYVKKYFQGFDNDAVHRYRCWYIAILACLPSRLYVKQSSLNDP